MQLMQIFFGLASAAEVAYYSYMYAVVDEQHYRKVTSYIRSAALSRENVRFGLAQISLVAVCTVFFIAIALPSVPSPTASCQPLDNLTYEGRSQKETLTEDEVKNKKLEKGAILAFLVQFAAINWNQYDGVALCNIRLPITTESYGLGVWDGNTLLAVVLQTALTLIVVDSHGLNLSIRTQFVVYAAYFGFVAALFVVGSICSRFQKITSEEEDDSTQEETT
ncbi:reduced folate carrier [Cooperia oncophora]